MQRFIAEHLLGEVADVYCGAPDVFKGSVKASANNMLILEPDEKYTHAIDKIRAIWRRNMYYYSIKECVEIIEKNGNRNVQKTKIFSVFIIF